MDILSGVGSEATTIRELIDKMARTQPEAIFLISPETGRSLTFRGLQEQSTLLSTQLRQAGLERGDKVAFLLDNGLFTAQLFLGAMYGGFVAVPLNVRAGVSTLSYTLDHCDAKVVFVGDPYAALLKEMMVNVRRPVKVIPADADGFATARESSASSMSLPVPVPEDEALLMYTSGSTGQPKAAVHSHRTVLAGGRNSISSYKLSPTDRSLLVLPLYHINAECVTLIPALLSGGSVVVPHGFSVSQFWDWLDDWRCTWSALVPTIISQLLDWKDPRADSRQAAFQRIRFLRTSSAPLSPALHREFLDKFKLLLIQAMGSTEAGNIFSNPLPPGANKIGSPGLPWGFETKIVNREGVEVPAGEPGEVLVRGQALMQGYYKDPEGTAAVLGPDGWFHTGDLAYRDEDGYFFVVGRSKELIIKGGVNIAPKQIDEVLESHPAVLEAAAVGVPDHYLGEDLVAFVVLRAGSTSGERELLAFCESRLGHFKTPTRIHFVKDLPKGPSGKVQRLKLHEQAARPTLSEPGPSGGEAGVRRDGQAGQAGMQAASTPIEQIIAETWAELLAQPQVDVHSNFFSLGGHSLLAIQCLSRLREKLPLSLSLSDFFENATVAQQAALVRRRLCPDAVPAGALSPEGRSEVQPPVDQSTADWEQALLRQLAPSTRPETIPLRDRALPCPLSPAQQRLWFLEQLNPGVPVYNESEAVRLKGELNADALESAVNAIIARHEVLRTTFEASGEEPAAVVHESWPLRLKRIDLRHLSTERRAAEVERLLVEEPRRQFHLKTEPGIRLTVIQLAAEEHVLILMIHHIICDRLSLGVLWRELGRLYEACLNGRPAPLPALAIQYGDYAAWQQRQLRKGSFEQDLSFWKENLRGAPKLLDLPADRPRPHVISCRGDKRRFGLSPALSESLRNLGRREQTSLFTIFAAALSALLYRYTGQDDILLGIPIADRDRPELQALIGCLIDTHVLRTNLAGNPTFRELLGRVQKGVLGVYSHRAVPFEQVVEAVQPERNLSYSPLFQVVLNWRDRGAQLQFVGFPRLAIEPLLAQSLTSKFDLTVVLTDAVEDIRLELEYSTDLFDDARIQRMVGHYHTLLEAVAADPGRRLRELPLLTEAERQQLVVEWTQTQQDYPRNRCIHELFEEQVERAPEAMAVVSEDRRLTYRELNERANQLAHRLRKLGVGAGTLVGVCMERSPEYAVCALGILKAGGAYVPLDTDYPLERLHFMLGDCGASVVLTAGVWPKGLGLRGTTMVDLAAEAALIESCSRSNPDSVNTAENPAYVMYTSGSTGQPKGTAIPHRAVVRLVRGQGYAEFDSHQRFLLLASTSFDASTFELWGALLNGAMCAVHPERLPDLESLEKAIRQHGVTCLWLTAGLFNQIIDLRPSVLETVAHVLTGGEALSVPHVKKAMHLLPALRLTNGYGPTECTTFTTAYAIRHGETFPTGSVPIGRPLANTRCYVLDARLQLVPVGVAAELYVGGDGLACGYLNRPELTAEKFVIDPFSQDPKARLYRTGDRCRWLGDGNLEFVGRVDDQVKLRGFRIELGEIESVLAAHPAVREAVVAVREDVPGDKRLVAYLTTKAGEPPKVSELRDSLQAKLPDYMVPAAFVTLEALPVTPNGKVDRRALPAPNTTRPDWTGGYVAPRTPVEAKLAGIWAEILALDRVGIQDNFFELGGHSLLATQVMSRMRGAFGLELPLRCLFEAPTIVSLAAYVETMRCAIQLQETVSSSDSDGRVGKMVVEEAI